MMIKFLSRKLILLCALTFVSSITGFLIWSFYAESKARKPANFDVEPRVTEIRLIKDMRWTNYRGLSKITLYSDGADLCQYWNAIEVTFRSEGLAYSGEPDRLIQTADCSDQGFQQDWSHNIEDSYELQKIGVFQESPEAWGLEQIKLLGPAGTKILTGLDIYKQTGMLPLIK